MSETIAHPRCPTCGYVLLGLTEPRCPECGEKFPLEIWSDLSRLSLAPPWERRAYLGRFRAFFATLLSATFRPRRILAGIADDRRLGAALAWALLTVLLAFVIALTLSRSRYVGFSVLNLHLNREVATLIRTALRFAALLSANMLVWLPTLAVLDLVLLKHRREFRLILIAYLYTLAWSFWPATLMPGLGNWLLGFIDSDWLWGNTVGWSWIGSWPWPCWMLAALVTLQFLGMRRFVRVDENDLRRFDAAIQRHVSHVLMAGWLLAMYLLLFDRLVHLRFHMLFVVEEWRHLFWWLYR